MIERLSIAQGQPQTNESALIMVGSFAPLHPGQIDAMESAERVLLSIGDSAAGAVFAPNSDSYVSVKLNDTDGKWSFDRRVSHFLGKDAKLATPVYVDDITGKTPPERSISEEVIDTVSKQLGTKACNAVLVVGSDQILSMKAHIERNRVICVLRPGYINALYEHENDAWFKDAVYEHRFFITTHMDMASKLSSTAIRENVQQS